MPEGPQVRLATERLARELVGRSVLGFHTSRDNLLPFRDELVGQKIGNCFCKGKHVFIRFGDESYLHNHMLMRGKWKTLDGQLLFLPPGAWLGIYVGPYTVCNFRGQMLEIISKDEVDMVLTSLGPDLMEEPCEEAEIKDALIKTKGSIAEALLNQSVVSGVGNVARSEGLYLAGIDPHTPSQNLQSVRLDHLMKSLLTVLWQSYKKGGRWMHRVYRRKDEPCMACGHPIHCVRLPPSKRSVYYCPACQV